MRPGREHPVPAQALARGALVAFGAALVADLASLATGWSLGHTVTKPLLMPLLALHARVRGGSRLLVAALLSGWGGDVLLLSRADAAFLAGMACFAAGHLCYLVLFRRYGAPRARGARLAAVYGAALVATVAVLWPGLPAALRVPVAGYSVLLTAMAYGATRLGPVAGFGGVLFMLSDTLIATGVADRPQLPRPDLWIMLTYAAAQFLLVRGTPVSTAPGPDPTVPLGAPSRPARP